MASSSGVSLMTGLLRQNLGLYLASANLEMSSDINVGVLSFLCGLPTDLKTINLEKTLDG